MARPPTSTVTLLLAFTGVLVTAEPTLATQAHGAPEGLYAHQFAHLFFLVSMASLVYWLRTHQLVAEPGWRYIQYAAILFMLWNADTFLVHLLDEQLALVAIERTGPWSIRISTHTGSPFLSTFYYLIKLDHLICVPALFCLYIGLRRLLKTAQANGKNEAETP